MRLAIILPDLEMAPDSVRISRWEKAEGESVEFGDVLCELQASRWLVASRTKNAAILARLVSPRKVLDRRQPMVCPTCKGAGIGADGDTCEDCLRYQIVAAESGVFMSPVRAAGETVGVGEEMGHVESGTPEVADSDRKLRIVVNMLDRSLEDL